MALLHDGMHQREGWWSRRSKASKLGIITSLFLLIAGVAFALINLFGGFTGSVDGANFEIIFVSKTGQPANTDCVLTDEATNINLTWISAFPGDVCDARVTYEAPGTNDGDIRLQSFSAPTGLVATFPVAMCGTTYVPGSGNLGVIVDLTFDGSEESIVFDVLLHGFQFVTASNYNAGNCNPVTP